MSAARPASPLAIQALRTMQGVQLPEAINAAKEVLAALEEIKAQLDAQYIVPPMS